MKVSKALHGAFASLYQVMVSKGISAVEPLAKCDGSEGTRNFTEFRCACSTDSKGKAAVE